MNGPLCPCVLLKFEAVAIVKNSAAEIVVLELREGECIFVDAVCFAGDEGYY